VIEPVVDKVGCVETRFELFPLLQQQLGLAPHEPKQDHHPQDDEQQRYERKPLCCTGIVRIPIPENLIRIGFALVVSSDNLSVQLLEFPLQKVRASRRLSPRIMQLKHIHCKQRKNSHHLFFPLYLYLYLYLYLSISLCAPPSIHLHGIHLHGHT